MNSSFPSPLVSVVMGVHNGAPQLRETVQSILAQEGVDLEFIIVDDGSMDETGQILAELAKNDARLRILRQDPRAGLTRALILGCGHARGRFIARQDCGDISLPGRLEKELSVFARTPEAALVSCAVRFTGPAGEFLYDAALTQEEATHGLSASEPSRYRGPAHHGGTLFRRDWYESVGGYRKEFYFAQDLDLWTRLAAHGPHVALPDVLYEAVFAINSISGLHRHRQVKCAELIHACGVMRQQGRSETEVLVQADLIRPGAVRPSSRDTARALYFLGSCLRQQGNPGARRYFLRAFLTYPLHLKALARLLLG